MFERGPPQQIRSPPTPVTDIQHAVENVEGERTLEGVKGNQKPWCFAESLPYVATHFLWVRSRLSSYYRVLKQRKPEFSVFQVLLKNSKIQSGVSEPETQ